jgi:hypothetical protein
MLLFIVGIKLWTIAVVFLISLGVSLVIQNQIENVKVYEPAYKEFVKCISMFAIILLFMALTVKKVSYDEMDDLLLYSTIPIMVNFIMAIPSWFVHRYRQEKRRKESVHRGLLGDY